MKKCITCGKEFLRIGKAGSPKTCSYECRIENLRLWNSVIVKKKCQMCKKDFDIIRRYKCKRKFCDNCTNKAKSFAKTKEKNPNWIGGKEFHKKPKYSLRMRRHNFVCRQFRKVFEEEKGYEFCEICGISDPIQAFKFDTHHIYYASRVPKNENLHHPKNLILLCRNCHRKFHGGEYKELFEKIEKERGLKELFAEGKIINEPPVFDYRKKPVEIINDPKTGRLKRKGVEYL